MHPPRRHLLQLMALAAMPSLARADAAAPFTDAAGLRADLAFIRDSIARLHPDPGFSADTAALAAMLERLGQDLPATLNRDEAWRRLATLNPLLADGHFFIGYPNWRGAIRTRLADGGSLFPVEVAFDSSGKLVMAEAKATRIVSIDGVDTASLVPKLLARTHGDTPAFRTHLLAQRWAFFYWKLAGAPEVYRLVLERNGRRRKVDMPGSRVLPAYLRREDSFEDKFRLAIRPDGVAVLTVGSFSEPDPAPFLAFTRAAFARIRDAGVRVLEIDISGNGGGDDALWLDGLMPYLASERYRTGSTWRGFERASPDRVSEGEISTWRAPQSDNPLRFTGRVLVRIDPGSYSSAILFANVMRDFGFATLVGAGGAARRSQSGGTRDVKLPHSGLLLTLPRFILDPPAGKAPGMLLDAQPERSGEPI